MSSLENKGEDKNLASYSTYDLDGFEGLWNISLEEVEDFVNKGKKPEESKANQNETDFLKQEIQSRNFEIEKLKWQLTERDKELKQLYEEVEEILSLNKQLNGQLERYNRILSQKKI